MKSRIILASASPFRKAMLENAGIACDVVPANVDERAIEAAIGDSGVTPADVARILAEAKAQEVSARFPDALVIGSDQTLSLGDEILHKSNDMDAARKRLLQLSGKIHDLNSSVALARRGETIWAHTGIARMTMRKFDPAFVGRYLSAAGPQVLASVGVYQIEGPGIQLFEAIDGDHFTIIGLPLLPLLKALRDEGAIDG
ncbi:MAG: Maf-like protein [Mesorhizobium sp.]|nr:Maf-like protein [Mesorhizobium sp.]